MKKTERFINYHFLIVTDKIFDIDLFILQKIERNVSQNNLCYEYGITKRILKSKLKKLQDYGYIKIKKNTSMRLHTSKAKKLLHFFFNEIGENNSLVDVILLMEAKKFFSKKDKKLIEKIFNFSFATNQQYLKEKMNLTFNDVFNNFENKSVYNTYESYRLVVLQWYNEFSDKEKSLSFLENFTEYIDEYQRRNNFIIRKNEDKDFHLNELLKKSVSDFDTAQGILLVYNKNKFIKYLEYAMIRHNQNVLRDEQTKDVSKYFLIRFTLNDGKDAYCFNLKDVMTHHRKWFYDKKGKFNYKTLENFYIIVGDYYTSRISKKLPCPTLEAESVKIENDYMIKTFQNDYLYLINQMKNFARNKYITRLEYY